MRCLLVFWLLAAGLPLAAQDAQPTRLTPATATPQNRIAAADWATATAIASIEPVEHHLLRRPIALEDDNVHWVDRTYPYGSTQWGARAVHLGVEFVNPRYTPVYAAAPGRVIFAGDDADFLLGPQKNYYGRVVILAHDLRSLEDLPVFTLYAHLERIDVATGQAVAAGEALGQVGSSGVALGAHLHFEVRVGVPFDYRMTRNPALWLQQYAEHGMIAGFVHYGDGVPIDEKRIAVRADGFQREVFTYHGERVNSDPVWGENFTVSDLPAGSYEVLVLDDGGRIAYRSTVDVRAYQIAFLDIAIDN